MYPLYPPYIPPVSPVSLRGSWHSHLKNIRPTEVDSPAVSFRQPRRDVLSKRSGELFLSLTCLASLPLQYGQIEITNHTTGDYSVLHFKPGGWFGREVNKVEGSIFSPEYV